jgi:lysophospholipase L1-like esterase
MTFRTEIFIQKPVEMIAYEDQLLLIGSCFVENMGKKFQEAGFQTTINPFGTLYNPYSLAQAIERLLNPIPFQSTDLFSYEGVWHSFTHHSRFSHVSQEETLRNINEELALGAQRLKSARWLMITLGTAWVYRLADARAVVANCHKLPEKRFIRERMSEDAIVQLFTPLIERLHVINPALQLLMTVSPIRHWKDGAHENQLSKSTLLLAIERIQQQCSFVHYFPAYELMMDELRDYRFYAEDMIHPNATAIEFIWEKLTLHYLNREAQQTLKEVEQLNKALQHRSLHPNSEADRKFQHQTAQRIAELQKRYPFLHFNSSTNTEEPNEGESITSKKKR